MKLLISVSKVWIIALATAGFFACEILAKQGTLKLYNKTSKKIYLLTYAQGEKPDLSTLKTITPSDYVAQIVNIDKTLSLVIDAEGYLYDLKQNPQSKVLDDNAHYISRFEINTKRPDVFVAYEYNKTIQINNLRPLTQKGWFGGGETDSKDLIEKKDISGPYRIPGPIFKTVLKVK